MEYWVFGLITNGFCTHKNSTNFVIWLYTRENCIAPEHMLYLICYKCHTHIQAELSKKKLALIRIGILFAGNNRFLVGDKSSDKTVIKHQLYTSFWKHVHWS